MASFNHNYLLKAISPSTNTVTLEVRASTHKFGGGDTNIRSMTDHQQLVVAPRYPEWSLLSGKFLV